MATITAPVTPRLKRHPIRGAVWGLVGGIGLSLLLVVFGVIAMGTLPPLLIPLCVLVLGSLWGTFAPAKKAKGAAPSVPTEVERLAPPAPAEPVPPSPAPDPTTTAAEASPTGAPEEPPRSPAAAPPSDPPPTGT